MFRNVTSKKHTPTEEDAEIPNISTFANPLANPLTLDPFAFNDIEPNTMKTTTSKSRKKPKVTPLPLPLAMLTTKRKFSELKHHGSPKHHSSPKHQSPKHHGPGSPKHPGSPPRQKFDTKALMRNVLTSPPMIPPTTSSKPLDDIYNRFIRLDAATMENKDNLEKNIEYIDYLSFKISKLDPNERKLFTDRLRDSDNYVRIMSILTHNNGDGDKDYNKFFYKRLNLSDLLHNSLRTKVLLTEMSQSNYKDIIDWFHSGIIISINVHGTTMARTSDKIPVLDMFQPSDIGLDSVSNAYLAEIGTHCRASFLEFDSFNQKIQDALLSTNQLSIEGVSDIVRSSLHGKKIKLLPSKSKRDNSHNHMKSMYQPGLFTLDVVNAASSKKILNKQYSCDETDSQKLGIRIFTSDGTSTLVSCPSKITTIELLKLVKKSNPNVTHVYVIDASCSALDGKVFEHYYKYIHDKTASFNTRNRFEKDTLSILRRLIPNEATRERGGGARKRRSLRKRKYSTRRRTRKTKM